MSINPPLNSGKFSRPLPEGGKSLGARYFPTRKSHGLEDSDSSHTFQNGAILCRDLCSRVFPLATRTHSVHHTVRRAKPHAVPRRSPGRSIARPVVADSSDAERSEDPWLPARHFAVVAPRGVRRLDHVEGHALQVGRRLKPVLGRAPEAVGDRDVPAKSSV